MTYRVTITPNAEQDLRAIHGYIRKQAPRAGEDWLRGARRKIKSLARRPERCHLAPESDRFSQAIRQLLYGKGSRGSYRILFVILERDVYILHVRHGSREILLP